MEWTSIRRGGVPNREAKDEDHLMAMAAMQELIKEPKSRGDWLKNKRKEFDAIT